MQLRMSIVLVLIGMIGTTAQAQCPELDLYSELYIVPNELWITIKEGHDELVECLRWAANQGKVEIGECEQIAGLKVPGLKSTYADFWDERAAETGLKGIHFSLRFGKPPNDIRNRAFNLVFEPFLDILTAYRLYYRYASLPYVENAWFSELLETTGKEMPSAISETTWGSIKRFSRKAFPAKELE